MYGLDILLNMIIPLTKGKYAIIDKKDFPLVSKFKWQSVGQKGYASATKKRILMHRLIMSAKNGQEIDHINGNIRDNRRKNLRFVTHQQNCFNHRGYKKYKGVTKVNN